MSRWPITPREVRLTCLSSRVSVAPRTLDPLMNQDVPGTTVAQDLFEGLLRTNPAGKVVAGVAERFLRAVEAARDRGAERCAGHFTRSGDRLRIAIQCGRGPCSSAPRSPRPPHQWQRLPQARL